MTYEDRFGGGICIACAGNVTMFFVIRDGRAENTMTNVAWFSVIRRTVLGTARSQVHFVTFSSNKRLVP